MADSGRPDMIRGRGTHRPPRLIRAVLAALAVGTAAAVASCASAPRRRARARAPDR
jgi:hypothetical protein